MQTQLRISDTLCGVVSLLFADLLAACGLSAFDSNVLSNACCRPCLPCFHVSPQRILKVDYHIPSHIKLSPEGHDLLKKVLVADPTQRINIQQVGQAGGISGWAPWARSDLLLSFPFSARMLSPVCVIGVVAMVRTCLSITTPFLTLLVLACACMVPCFRSMTTPGTARTCLLV